MTRIVYNKKFPAEIDRQVEFRAGKVRVAEEVVEIAKANAPYRSHPGDHYRDSLGVHIVGPAVYVRATDWKGHWIEWGTAAGDRGGRKHPGTPIFAPIRKAVLEAGLRLDEVER